MVKYNVDSIFHALADSTRRDILHRVSTKSLPIKDLASDYKMSFAAVSKHVAVLERAKLVTKEREGRQAIITLQMSTLHFAQEQLSEYEKLWDTRLNQLDALLSNS